MSIAIMNYPPYLEGNFKNPSANPYTYVNAADWSWWGGRGIDKNRAFGVKSNKQKGIWCEFVKST